MFISSLSYALKMAESLIFKALEAIIFTHWLLICGQLLAQLEHIAFAIHGVA